MRGGNKEGRYILERDAIVNCDQFQIRRDTRHVTAPKEAQKSHGYYSFHDIPQCARFLASYQCTPVYHLRKIAMSHGITKATADRNQRILLELVQKPGNGKWDRNPFAYKCNDMMTHRYLRGLQSSNTTMDVT